MLSRRSSAATNLAHPCTLLVLLVISQAMAIRSHAQEADQLTVIGNHVEFDSRGVIADMKVGPFDYTALDIRLSSKTKWKVVRAIVTSIQSVLQFSKHQISMKTVGGGCSYTFSWAEIEAASEPLELIKVKLDDGNITIHGERVTLSQYRAHLQKVRELGRRGLPLSFRAEGATEAGAVFTMIAMATAAGHTPRLPWFYAQGKIAPASVDGRFKGVIVPASKGQWKTPGYKLAQGGWFRAGTRRSWQKVEGQPPASRGDHLKVLVEVPRAPEKVITLLGVLLRFVQRCAEAKSKISLQLLSVEKRKGQ